MSASSYSNIFTRGVESGLPSTVTDGKLRFTTDTHKIFLDNGTTRIEFTDIIQGMTTIQIKGQLAPLPKLYLSSDDGRLYYSDGTNWHSVAAEKAVGDKNGNDITTTYAPLSSPALTGAPTTPDVSVGDSSGKIANTKFVADTVADFINAVASTGTGNAYTNASTAEDAGGGIKLTLEKGSTFLTEHPAISTATASTSVAPAFGSTVDAISSLTIDSNGHVTDYTKSTITVPNSTATTGAAGLLPALSGSTTTYLRGDGTWATVSGGDDVKVKNKNSTSSQGFPLMLVNATTASTEDVTDETYRNGGIYAIPSSGTLKASYIDAKPAAEVEFDFGYLASTTPGDEVYA